jgi:hypothetical protein
MLETSSELKLVREVLRRRFPGAYSLLTESLERADPLEIVYPGNPGEYDDVIREILVLAAHVNGALGELPVDQLDAIVRDGLARCYSDLSDEDRVREAVRLIATGASRG